MQPASYEEVIQELVREDSRYREEAYEFIRNGLDFTAKKLAKPQKGPGRHISGQELTEGLKQYALNTYGPMAMSTLDYMGIRRTEDFGALVFNLVNKGILGRTDEDKIEDFANGFDFNEAFRAPFQPRSIRVSSHKKSITSDNTTA